MKRMLFLLCAVALSLSAAAQTDYVETWDPDADGDGLIGVSDLLALLGVFQEEDMDSDGIWDSDDDCVGFYDECGSAMDLAPKSLELTPSLSFMILFMLKPLMNGGSSRLEEIRC